MKHRTKITIVWQAPSLAHQSARGGGVRFSGHRLLLSRAKRTSTTSAGCLRLTRGRIRGDGRSQSDRVDFRRAFTDKASGATMERPQLIAPMIEAFKEFKAANDELRALVEAQGREFRAYKAAYP